MRKERDDIAERVERVKLDACGWIGSCEIEEEEIKAKERENIFAMRMLCGGGGGGDADFLPNLTHVSLENNGFGPDVPDLTTTGIFSKAKCVSLKNNAISLLSNAGERMRYMERLRRLTSPRTIFQLSRSFGSSATKARFHVFDMFVWQIIHWYCGRSTTSTITSLRSFLLLVTVD